MQSIGVKNKMIVLDGFADLYLFSKWTGIPISYLLIFSLVVSVIIIFVYLFVVTRKTGTKSDE